MPDIVQFALQQARSTVMSKDLSSDIENSSMAIPFEPKAYKTANGSIGLAASKLKKEIACAGASEDDLIDVFDKLLDFIKLVETHYHAIQPETDWELEQAKKSTADVIAAVSAFSLKLANDFARKRNALQAEKRSEEDKKAQLQKEITTRKDELRKYDQKLSGYLQRMEAIRKDVDACILEILEARSKMGEISGKIRKARKWCWVPFYNIVLLIDGVDAESRYEAVKHKLESAERDRDALLKESGETVLGILSTDMERSYLQLLTVTNNQSMNEYNVKIDLCTSRALMCSDFALFLGSVHSSLSYIGSDAVLPGRQFFDMETMLTELKNVRRENGSRIAQLAMELKKAAPIKLVGPLNKNVYTHFAEIKPIVNRDLRISGIMLRSGDIVDAIQLILGDGTKGMVIGNDRGGTDHVIMFENDDTLESVSGLYGVRYWDKNVLSRIRIRTKKGLVYGPFGVLDEHGTPFELKVPKDAIVRGILGSAFVDCYYSQKI